MKKGQVFTIDLVVGSIIILSVITSAYALTSYYLSLNGSITTNSDFISQIYSAVSSFSTVSPTANALVLFQNSGSASNLDNYVSSVLGSEISSPFLFQVFTKTDYYSNSTPNDLIFSYNSGFSPSSSYSTFYEPVLVANYSSACDSSCNSSLSINSVFPSYNDTINAENCNVLYSNGTSTGWTILNNTPSGDCTIEIPSYAGPNSYDVTTTAASGASTGSATLYVLAIDLLKFEVQK